MPPAPDPFAGGGTQTSLSDDLRGPAAAGPVPEAPPSGWTETSFSAGQSPTDDLERALREVGLGVDAAGGAEPGASAASAPDPFAAAPVPAPPTDAPAPADPFSAGPADDARPPPPALSSDPFGGVFDTGAPAPSVSGDPFAAAPSAPPEVVDADPFSPSGTDAFAPSGPDAFAPSGTDAFAPPGVEAPSGPGAEAFGADADPFARVDAEDPFAAVGTEADPFAAVEAEADPFADLGVESDHLPTEQSPPVDQDAATQKWPALSVDLVGNQAPGPTVAYGADEPPPALGASGSLEFGFEDTGEIRFPEVDDAPATPPGPAAPSLEPGVLRPQVTGVDAGGPDADTARFPGVPDDAFPAGGPSADIDLFSDDTLAAAGLFPADRTSTGEAAVPPGALDNDPFADLDVRAAGDDVAPASAPILSGGGFTDPGDPFGAAGVPELATGADETTRFVSGEDLEARAPDPANEAPIGLLPSLLGALVGLVVALFIVPGPAAAWLGPQWSLQAAPTAALPASALPLVASEVRVRTYPTEAGDTLLVVVGKAKVTAPVSVPSIDAQLVLRHGEKVVLEGRAPLGQVLHEGMLHRVESDADLARFRAESGKAPAATEWPVGAEQPFMAVFLSLPDGLEGLKLDLGFAPGAPVVRAPPPEPTPPEPPAKKRRGRRKKRRSPRTDAPD